MSAKQPKTTSPRNEEVRSFYEALKKGDYTRFSKDVHKVMENKVAEKTARK